MYGRQVTIRDLSLLMMDLDSQLSFDEAYDQVADLLRHHPNGDSPEVRAMLEFEMVDALMESEVRDDEDLIVEGLIRATRHGIIEPEAIPPELAEKVANRMQFQEEYAAEESHPKNYMVHADIARIVNSAHRLERLQNMFSDYDEWFKSRLSVNADTLDSLADYLEDQESFIMEEINARDSAEYLRQEMSAETSEPIGNFPKPAPFKGISYRSLLL
mgnify:CR=1 FL=1